MNDLKHQALVDYARGRILISDRAALEAHACECHRVLRVRREELLEGDKL
jgi:hypothetical protein